MNNKKLYFAQTLRSLIEGNKMKLDDLAGKLGITKQAISTYCTGKATPNITTLVELSEIFNVSTDYLLTGKRRENQITREELGLSERALELLSKIAHAKGNEELSDISEQLNKILSDKDFYLYLKNNQEIISQKIEDFQFLKQISENLDKTEKNNIERIKKIIEETMLGKLITDSANHMQNFFRLFYTDLLASASQANS